MNFRYSDEQNALQDTLRHFLGRNYSFAQRRAILESERGASAQIWKQFADLGLLALPFAERDGGLGGSAVDLMIVMEAIGRGLVLEPYLPAIVLAGGLIQLQASTEQRAALLPEIAAGDRVVALAHYEADSRYRLDRISCVAKKCDNGYILSGYKSVVLGAPLADTFLVSARTADASDVSLFVVPAGSAGVQQSAYATQDGTRAADIRFDRVRVDAPLGAEHTALPAIERAIDRAGAALVAEAVGIMLALNEATLEYLKVRKQFGVPIGKFQALQHRMVDMLIATEQARSMAMLAAMHVDSEDAAIRRRAIAAARAYVGEASRHVGQEAVQLHGGMGVVDEAIVSHYFKRLTMIQSTFGDSDHFLGRFSESLRVA